MRRMRRREKHEDVKKEEVEEERKCHARFVYLGHLCLTFHWPATDAVSAFLFPDSPCFHIVHPLATAAGCLSQPTSAGLDANGTP